VRLGCRSVSRPTSNDRAISPIARGTAAWHSLVLAIGARLDLSSVGPLGHHHGMTDVATDPIRLAEGYRRMLLDYLGEDDPAIAQAATVLAAPRARRGGW
jgi:hypothetical protein